MWLGGFVITGMNSHGIEKEKTNDRVNIQWYSIT